MMRREMTTERTTMTMMTKVPTVENLRAPPGEASRQRHETAEPGKGGEPTAANGVGENREGAPEDPGDPRVEEGAPEALVENGGDGEGAPEALVENGGAEEGAPTAPVVVQDVGADLPGFVLSEADRRLDAV